MKLLRIWGILCLIFFLRKVSSLHTYPYIQKHIQSILDPTFLLFPPLPRPARVGLRSAGPSIGGINPDVVGRSPDRYYNDHPSLQVLPSHQSVLLGHTHLLAVSLIVLVWGCFIIYQIIIGVSPCYSWQKYSIV